MVHLRAHAGRRSCVARAGHSHRRVVPMYERLRRRVPKGRVRIAIHHTSHESLIAGDTLEVRAVFDVTEASCAGV
jgi:hypothetical protein